MSASPRSGSRSAAQPAAPLRQTHALRRRNAALERRLQALAGRNAALREREARYRELWSGGFEGVVIHDKGKVVDANPAYAALFGYSLKEMIGSSVYRHLDSTVHDAVRRRIGTRRRYRAQIVGVKKDGTRIHIEYHARPIQLHGRALRVVGVRDITHLMRHQEALRASEERFRNLVEGSIQGILVHRGGKPLFANRALADMVGYPSPEAITRLRSFKGLVKPAYWTRMLSNDARRIKGEAMPSRYQFEGRRKDGRALWLENSARVVSWDGQPAVQCTWIDVTEREEREQQLRAHERLLQAVVDTIPHAVFVKDAHARYRLVNRAMAELWQCPPERFIGRTTVQVGPFPPRLAWAISRLDRHVLRSGQPVDLADATIEVGGETRTYHVLRYPLLDEQGAVTGLVSMSENITERRRAEQALRDSELRFRSLVEGSIQGIAVFRGHRAVFANSAFARIAGYRRPEEILALTSFAHLTHPDDLQRLEAFLTSAIKEEQREPDIAFRGVRKDGRVIWVNAVVTSVVWSGVPCILIAMLDVTERVEAAERLAQSEERFRNLIEGSIQGIVIHRNYRPLFANQALADIFGYASVEELLALPSLEVLNAPDRRESARSGHEARLRGEDRPARYEIQGVRKDGRVIWLEIQARVVVWDGQPAVQYTILDATERKRSEEAVRASQRLLQTMLDAIPLCIFTKDRSGRIVFANRAQCEFDGFPPDRLMGLATEEYPNRTPEQTAQNLDWDRRVIQSRERVEIPAYVRQNAKGRSRWLRGLRLPLLDEGHRVVGQLGMNEDISEQREAELALRQSEERYRILLEGSIQGILIQRDFRSLFVNRRFSAMHGYDTPEEVLALPSSLVLLAPVEQERMMAFHRQHRQGERTPARTEVQAARKDGSTFWRENVMREVIWDDGLPAIQVTTQDITERKAAELQREELLASLRTANDRLAESRRLLRTIFDTIPHRLAVNDAGSRYLMVNSAMAQRYGHAEPEFIGRTPRELDFLPPEEQERFHETNLAVLDSGAPCEVPEVRCVLAGGREEIIRLLNVPVRDAQGQTVGVVGVAEDITERRRADQVRDELMADLRRANEDLRDFAYIVSHDLKAPLRGISSLAEWLAEDYADRMGEEGRENLQLLRARTRRMAALLEGILTYSRIGRLPASTEPLDSAAVVQDVMDTLGPPPHVRVEVEGPLPTVVYDATQLAQVFQNLIGNAIQHLGRPAGTVRVSCRREEGFWRFLVADDGVGIESRHFERIFKIFQRLKDTTEGGGTGLGLSVVKKIVENMGGTVRVESEPGRGSVFSFTVRDGLG
jgi:PAS domain S-box-containing protein